jgi:twitching motility protein PilT
MAAQDPESLLGRLAVHNKLLTLDQLAECTREQGRRGGRLGDIFVELRFITPKQLEKLVIAQKEMIARQQAAKAVAPQPAAPQARAPAQSAAPTPVRPASAAAQARPAPAAPAAAAARVAAAPAASLEASLTPLLRAAVEAGASDLHLHAGARVKMRVRGQLQETGEAPVGSDAVDGMLASLLSPEERKLFAEAGELDFCRNVPGVGRVRANAYRQQRGTDLVLRLIPAEPPTLDQLGLPHSLARFTNYHQGMVLVTGPAGCGKSSTLAALVNLVNEERREHILTIEDPIEYQHPSKRCLVNQRNVRHHTESFARALRAGLREDPDVIVIGELRDLETISLALSAAETGHFVLATLHTSDSVRTINRIIGAYPSNQQEQVRTMLSETLRAVISQRLVPTADGARRVTALEVLVINKAIGNLIRENKTFQIRSQLQTGAAQGMCLLDDAIARLVQQKLVSRETALALMEDPKRLGAA